MTAFTPSSAVPLAAQSRDEPGAVLLAGEDDERDAGLLVPLRGLEDGRHRAVVRVKSRVTPPSVPGASWLRSRMLANVPADHHLVVAAAGAVGVEVPLLDAVLGEVRARRASPS